MNEEFRSKIHNAEKGPRLLSHLSIKLNKPEFQAQCRILLGNELLSTTRLTHKPNVGLGPKGISQRTLFDSNGRTKFQTSSQTARSNLATERTIASMGSMAKETLTLKLQDQGSVSKKQCDIASNISTIRPNSYRVKRDMDFTCDSQSIKRIIQGKDAGIYLKKFDINSESKYFGRSSSSSNETINVLKEQLNLVSNKPLKSITHIDLSNLSFKKSLNLDWKVSQISNPSNHLEESKYLANLEALHKSSRASTLKFVVGVDQDKVKIDKSNVFKLMLLPIKSNSQMESKLTHPRVSTLISHLKAN